MKKNMWEFKQSADPAVAELYIYGDVESDSTNFWTGEVQRSETSANAFRAALEKSPELAQINIYINSYGGSVFEGTAIYNQLRRHPAHKTVYVDGFACSVASVIAMAGDEVVMPKNTLMMIHNMWMGAVGNAAELRKAADDLDTINAAGRRAYLTKAGKKLTEEKLTELMDAETWLTAEQCIALGAGGPLRRRRRRHERRGRAFEEGQPGRGAAADHAEKPGRPAAQPDAPGSGPCAAAEGTKARGHHADAGGDTVNVERRYHEKQRHQNAR